MKMDLGTIASLAKFYNLCAEYKKDKTRRNKKKVTASLKDMKYMIKSELKRKTITQEEYEELIKKLSDVVDGLDKNPGEAVENADKQKGNK